VSIRNWSVPNFDPRFESENEPHVRALVHHWLFWADPDVRQENIENTPSRQLRAYCETLESFFPEGKWPGRGDFLLCPGVFWSLDPKSQGTAATIFWGFEGAVGDDAANAVLALSQSLLAGITQFARAADVQAGVAVQRSVRENISHELRPVQRVLSPDFALPLSQFFAVSPRKKRIASKNDKSLGTITVAKGAENTLADMAIIPFRPAFDAGAFQLGMWLQTAQLVDLPPHIAQAGTWEAVTTACWQHASRVIAVLALGSDCPSSPEKLDKYRARFLDIVTAYPPLIKASDTDALWPRLRKDGPTACGICRVLAALYLNVCLHGDAGQSVETVLRQVLQNSQKWLELSVSNKRRDGASLASPTWFAEDVKGAASALNRIGMGAWHTHNVVEAVVASLGGTQPPWPTEPATSNTPYAVTFRLPEPEGAG
jgi:hypothetical protein